MAYAGIIYKPRNKPVKSSWIIIFYSAAYHYLMLCYHIRGKSYPSCPEKLYLVQKKLTRIIVCFPFRKHHVKPPGIVDRILNVANMNAYIMNVHAWLHGWNCLICFPYSIQLDRNIHDYDAIRMASMFPMTYLISRNRYQFKIRIFWNTSMGFFTWYDI